MSFPKKLPSYNLLYLIKIKSHKVYLLNIYCLFSSCYPCGHLSPRLLYSLIRIFNDLLCNPISSSFVPTPSISLTSPFRFSCCHLLLQLLCSTLFPTHIASILDYSSFVDLSPSSHHGCWCPIKTPIKMPFSYLC